MKIRMLGTGYGECKIKRLASKDYRHLGGVVIDSKILIDAPSDIFDIAAELGFSDIFDSIEAVIISHSHKGHFDPEAIKKLAFKNEITVFADKELLALIPDGEKIKKIEAYPFRAQELSGYMILPLLSNHRMENSKERALNYLITRDKTLLYLLDGGFIQQDSFRVVSELKLDAVIMDTSHELSPPKKDLIRHSSYEVNKIIKGMLTDAKAADEKTRFILSHIPSPRKRSVHEELSLLAKEDGFTVAYDGYFVNL